MKIHPLKSTVLSFCLFAFHATATTYYVDINSTNATPPYTNWSTASTDIQSAIDAASPGDIVLVTDGVYQAGGETINGYGLTNRVAIDQAITVESVDGPAATVIVGCQDTNSIVAIDSVRCIYMTNGAVLSGFTLTNGATLASGDNTYEQSGGGIFCESTNAIVVNCVIGNCAGVNVGGVVSGSLFNCTLLNNFSYNDNGGAQGSDMNGCILNGNWAPGNAGGAGGCILTDCLLTNNTASQWNGGGAYGGTLNHCTLTGNFAGSAGGGAIYSSLTNCQLIANAVGPDGEGGGACSCELDRCSILQNSAPDSGYGGGANNCTVNDSVLSGNSAGGNGGGAMYGTLNNCTIVGNSALGGGGGGGDAYMNNCIIYYNTAPFESNYVLDGEVPGSLNYCCIPDMPPGANGIGNITSDPQLADFAHISSGSPCIGAGNAAYVTGLDIDGQPWRNPPSIGCDEFYPGASGPLAVSARANFINVATGFTVNLSGSVLGHASYNVWNFGDGTVVSNLLFLSHSWPSPGNYPVTFTAYNDSNPGGISVTVMVQVVVNSISYVSLDSANPVAPYTSWNTAATNIQDAIDAEFAGGTVLVSNGVYNLGGKTINGFGLTNRVAIDQPITVESVNGPGATTIEGYQDTNSIVAPDSIRCVYMTNGAVLSGFSLTAGATLDNGDGTYEESGGGIFCESTNAIVTNCVIIGNAAGNVGGGANQGTFNNCIFAANASDNSGGGAINCLLNNCVLTNNIAGTLPAPAIRSKNRKEPIPLVILSIFGGGAEASTLNDCVLTSNSAQAGGGLDSSTANNCLILDNNAIFAGGANGSALNNCTIVGNIGSGDGAAADFSTLNNCIEFYNSGPDGYSTYNYCDSDQNPSGAGNITNDPAFVDWQNNDFHLTANSPCINSGDNLYVTTTNDFDGNPRIVGGTVDMGAYEYQTPTSVLSYAWAQQYGLPTDGSADYLDMDGTGMNNWQKWVAGLNPTNPASVLVMLPPTATNNSTGVTVTWQSVDNRNYYLLRATNIAAQAAFLPIASNIPGQAGTTSYTDPSATNNGPYFYRVAVQ